MTLIEEIKGLRLDDRGPCSDALEWLEDLGPDVTIQEAWLMCPRADWLIWWGRATRHIPPNQVLRRLEVRWRTRAARRRAAASRKPIDKRIEEALRVAAAYVEGQATREELDAARSALVTATSSPARGDALIAVRAAYSISDASFVVDDDTADELRAEWSRWVKDDDVRNVTV